MDSIMDSVIKILELLIWQNINLNKWIITLNLLTLLSIIHIKLQF